MEFLKRLKMRYTEKQLIGPVSEAWLQQQAYSEKVSEIFYGVCWAFPIASEEERTIPNKRLEQNENV